MSYWWVALGGALGSVARHAASGLAARLVGSSFPWGTLFVNVAGSLAIGALAGLASADGRPLLGNDARAFLMVGVLGGFTTFSAFSLETLHLARNGEWLGASANAMFSVLLCLAAVWLGYVATTALNR